MTEAKNNTHPETEVQRDKDEGWTLVKGGKKKKEIKTKNSEIKKPEEMETATNLKRRRDSRDTEKDVEKKQLKTNSPKPEKQKLQPLQSHQPAPQRPAEKPQPKRPEPEKNTLPPPQRPAQIIPPPQQPKNTEIKHPNPPYTQNYLSYRLFQLPNNSPGLILKQDHRHRHQHPPKKEQILHQTNSDKP